MSERIFVSLGSNLGDRENNLSKAREEIQKIAKIIGVSSVYETEPVGYKEQTKFYNQVIEIQTSLAPEILLEKCLEIETRLGRVRTIKNRSRCIDIDILLYGDKIIKQHIILPHPRMTERAFVLIPFAEIAKEIVHPEKKQTIALLLEQLAKEKLSEVILISNKHK